MIRNLTLLLSFLPLFLQAQELQECTTDEVNALLFAQNPALSQAHEAMENQAYSFFKNLASKSGTDSFSTVLTIPVVVHIIYENPLEGITDAEVLQGIQYLNEGFADIGFYDQGEGVDTKIQFCLASRNPAGNPTTGINRVASSLTDVIPAYDSEMKNLSRWNPLSYLNIWLVRNINNYKLAGYATLPSWHGNPRDGVVMLAKYFPFPGVGNTTLIHEVGHYLGLYHTFHGGCYNQNCLLNGDLVCDTPPDATTAAPPQCTTPLNSCSTDANSGFSGDQKDLNWNYMDYGNHLCRNGFTQGQAERMRYFLQNVRQSLLSSKGCEPACDQPVTASFSLPATTISVGETLNFTNNSTGATGFQWLMNGVVFSTQANPSFQFNAVGKFEIKLVASNGDPFCEQEFSAVVDVICPTQASFTVFDSTTLVGSTVYFTNTSANANTWQWLIEGSSFATTQNASYFFPFLGDYEILLVASNSGVACADSFKVSIEVSCINARFSTTDVFPEPGQLVGFQNTSEGASDISWSVDGVPAGAAANLSQTFAEGVHQVCLTASTALCNDEFCQSLFVFDHHGEGCESTFLRIFYDGNVAGNLNAEAIVPTPEGDFLVSGTDLYDGFLALVSKTGELLWMKKISFYETGYEVILQMMIDSDGMLVATSGKIGINPLGDYIFKYDYRNHVMLWSTLLAQSHKMNLFKILEKPNGGNYLFLGTTSSYYYNVLLEINRLTGGVVASKQYNFGGWNVFHDGIIYNGSLYTANNHGNGGRRAGLSKFDLAGNQLWTRTYFTPVTETADHQFDRLFIENDTIIAYGYGAFNGGGAADDEEAVLVKTKLNGEVIWAKRYVLEGTYGIYIGSILPLPDGYVLQGNLDIIVDGSPAHFFIRTDKQGNVIWARLVKNAVSYFGHYATLKDGYIYFISDMGLQFLFGKMSLDGEITPPFCNNVTSVQVTVTDFPNPYAGLQNLTQTALSLTPSSITLPIETVATAANEICSCQAPSDSCALTPDPLLAAVSATCDSGSLRVTLSLWNNGGNYASATLPQGTPISFYASDPTAGAAQLLGVPSLPQDVAAGGQLTFSLKINAPPNQPIFVMLNDDGSTPTPWTFAQIAAANPPECFFENNLRSFQISHVPPVLDLGADVAVCHFSTATFDAGSQFVQYAWQDGSAEASFTAWLPGTYSVTATDVCGVAQTDSAEVSIIPTSIVEIGVDTAKICPGGFAYFIASGGFDHYVWSPADGLNCDTCASVVASPAAATTYSLFASTDEGCFSTDTVRVEILTTAATFDTLAFCTGDTVWLFGNPATSAGSYSAVFSGENGCDSTHFITLKIATDTTSLSQSASLCQGDSLLFFGTWISQPGSYQHLDATSSCAVQNVLTVSVLQPIETYQTILICQGETASVFGVATGAPGIFSQTFQAANGCDSTHQIEVFVLPTYLTSETVTICENETASIFGVPTSAPGTYSQTFQAANGCDSTHKIQLIVLETHFTSEVKTICENEPTVIFGNLTSTPGTYFQTFQSAAGGCDSTHQIELVALDTAQTFEVISICKNETATIFGTATSTPGFYSQTFPSANGCDSLHQIELLVNDTFRLETHLQICAGDSALIFGEWQNQAGTYLQIFQSAAGCDSTVLVELELADTLQTFEVISICEGETASIFGVPTSQPGTYSQHFFSVFGCDSTHVISLVAHDTFHVADSLFICFGDSVLVFGEWVSAAGEFVQNLTTAAGCDSTHVVNLEVGQAVAVDFETSPAQPGLQNGSAQAHVSGGAPPYHFNWSVPAPDTAFVAGLAAGNYGLTVTDAAGCSMAAQVEIPLGTSVFEIPGGHFEISPNPFSGSLKVALRLEKPAAVSVEIVDTWGRILRKNEPVTDREMKWFFDLKDLPPATYFCKISVDGASVSRAVVKQ